MSAPTPYPASTSTPANKEDVGPCPVAVTPHLLPSKLSLSGQPRLVWPGDTEMLLQRRFTWTTDILDISKRADFWDNITSESLIGFGILSVGFAASDQPSVAPDPEAKPNLQTCLARWLQAWCHPSSLIRTCYKWLFLYCLAVVLLRNIPSPDLGRAGGHPMIYEWAEDW